MKRVLVATSLLCLGLAFMLTVSGRPADDDELNLNPTKTGVGSVNCTTKDGRVGICVDYTLCYENGSIIKYAEPDDFEIRRKKPSCPGRNEWCCADDIITPEEIAMGKKPPIKTDSKSGVKNTTKPTVEPTIPGGTDVSMNANVTVGFRTGLGCGVPTDGLRQLNSVSQSVYGDCPWCVGIFRDGGNPNGMNSNGYFCTGSLIHPRVVLTAANCVKAAKDLNVTVRIGDYDLSNSTELFPHQTIAVEDRVVHENFNSGNKKNNIALLILSKAADIQDNVNTACLPRAMEPIVRASTCHAYGWGRDKDGRYRDITAKVAVSPTDKIGCQSALRAAGASKGYVVDDSSFCAEASPEVDTCPANHGAPLTCASEVDKSRFVQYGVNSWSLHCGPLGAPAVYSDMATLRTWVDGEMTKRSFDTATYTI